MKRPAPVLLEPVWSPLMRRLLRIALLVAIGFLLLSAVIAVARPETGAAEKIALAGAAVLLIWAASVVRRRLA